MTELLNPSTVQALDVAIYDMLQEIKERSPLGTDKRLVTRLQKKVITNNEERVELDQFIQQANLRTRHVAQTVWLKG